MTSTMGGDLALGILSNYLFGIISQNLPEKLKSLAPALFFGGNSPVAEAEKAFKEARAALLEKYRGDIGVKRFLSDQNLKAGSLEMLFANIFLSKQFVSKAFDDIFYDCFDNPKIARSSGYKIVIDDIISTIRQALLSRSETAPFVLESSLREIKNSIDAVKNIASMIDVPAVRYQNAIQDSNSIDAYSTYYLKEIKDYIKTIFISGLESLSKKERVTHHVDASYVPILLHTAPNLTEKKSDVSRVGALSVIRDVPRMIVRGPAGCGKTTLLQWIIWNAEPFSDLPSSVDHHGMFPIYLPLRRLEATGTFSFSIDNVLYNSMPNDLLKRDYPKGWLDQVVARDIEVILLVDGIDEVGEESRPAIWRLIGELCNKFPKLRLLITSRHISSVHLADGSYRPEIFYDPDSYSEARKSWNRPDDFFEFVVSPLSNGDVADLIDKWYVGVDPSLLPRSDRDELAGYPEKLKKSIFESENSIALELARTPLLCSLVCLVFFLQRGQLPKNRKQLYDLSTNLLVETRDEHKGVKPDLKLVNFNLERRLNILKEIALVMQEGFETVQADQSIEVDKKRVIAWIKKHLQSQTVLSETAEFYLDFMINRCSLLREPSTGRIDFLHRSFMEYLAAEEIVQSRDPIQIRDRIRKDEWWGTIVFCMNTTTGGAYFGSILLNEILEWTLSLEHKSRRKNLLKAISLTKYLAHPTAGVKDKLMLAVKEVLPPTTSAEAADLSSVPVEVLEELLSFNNIEQRLQPDGVMKCVELLCSHVDPEVKRILLSGYVKLEDRVIIRMINETGLLTVNQHVALQKRLQNQSYKEPVLLSTEDLRNKDLRASVMHSVWLKFPATGNQFVGWDTLHRCLDIRFQDVRQADLSFMFASVNKWRFENCRTLTILYGHGFNFEVISELMPNVETIIVQRSAGIQLNGLNKMPHLRDIWFENCTQTIQVDSENIPKNLGDIIFFRSVNPIVKSCPPTTTIHTEKESKDHILLSSSRPA